MKLTKTMKRAWIKSILESEVVTTDFAGLEREVWDDHLIAYMPVAIAELYKSPIHREWVNPAKIAKIKEDVVQSFSTTKNKQVIDLIAKLDRIDEMRDRHETNLDNIKAGLARAADSVTTVAGLAKLLPQYAKYLPKTPSRPTYSEAQASIIDLNDQLAAIRKPPRRNRSTSRRKSHGPQQ